MSYWFQNNCEDPKYIINLDHVEEFEIEPAEDGFAVVVHLTSGNKHRIMVFKHREAAVVQIIDLVTKKISAHNETNFGSFDFISERQQDGKEDYIKKKGKIPDHIRKYYIDDDDDIIDSVYP